MRWREMMIGCLAGVMLVGVIVLTRLSDRSASGQSSLPVRFEPPLIDLGSVPQAQRLERKFVLRNDGTESVRISGLRTTCGCTVLPDNVLGQTLEPHTSIRIPVEFHSATQEGPVLARLTIRYQGARIHGEAVGRITAEVWPEFTLEPPMVDFGDLTPGSAASRLVQFRPDRANELRVLEARSVHEGITVELLEPENPGGGPRALIRYTAPLVARSHFVSTLLQFTTSSELLPSVLLPVRARVVPLTEVLPDFLVLPASGSTGSARLTIRTDVPSRISRLEINTPSEARELSRKDGLSMAGEDLTHVLEIAWDELTEASHLRIELLARLSADRIEARSAVVNVERL
jgi:hypothetical protein